MGGERSSRPRDGKVHVHGDDAEVHRRRFAQCAVQSGQGGTGGVEGEGRSYQSTGVLLAVGRQAFAALENLALI